MSNKVQAGVCFFQKAPFDKVSTDGKDRVDNNADNVENVVCFHFASFPYGNVTTIVNFLSLLQINQVL